MADRLAGSAPNADYSAFMRPWAQAWSLPGLESAVAIRFSNRLRHSAARCYPTRGVILLHPALASAPRQALATVLCHELAHVAAYLLHGRTIKPHGPEWAALVTAAGFRPSRAERPSALNIPAPSPRRQPSQRYLHRCPVCHFSRIARRPVSAWRCADCVAAGLEGRFEITPHAGAHA